MSDTTLSATNPAEENAQMTFWDHLEAFRWVLVRAVGILFAAFIGCFIAMPTLFSKVIMAPTTSNFILYQWLSGIAGDGVWLPDFSQPFNAQIISINLASQFMTHITTSICLALMLIFPYLITELWIFIRPALYENEKRSVMALLLFGIPMFYIGCTVGYFIVFPFTFRFLAMYELSADVPNMISLNSYIDNFMMMIFVMGIVFELPFVTWILSRLGLVTRTFLRQYRRHAVAVLLLLAAIITPTGDPFTLMVVFLPLYLLFEMGILLARDPEPDPDDSDSDPDNPNGGGFDTTYTPAPKNRIPQPRADYSNFSNFGPDGPPADPDPSTIPLHQQYYTPGQPLPPDPNQPPQ